MAGEDNLQDIPTPMYSGATDQPGPDQPAAPAMDLSHVQLVGPTQPLPQKGSAQTSVQPQLQGPTMPLPQLQGPTMPLPSAKPTTTPAVAQQTEKPAPEQDYSGAEGFAVSGFEQGALPDFAPYVAEKAGKILEAWTRGLTAQPVTGFEQDVSTEVPSREQFAKEHPYASGIAETVGEKIGGMLGSPEYWPLLALPFGSAAPFLIRAAISAGFTEELARGVFSQASKAGADWDSLDIKEKVKRVTSMVVDGAMAGMAAEHTAKLGVEGAAKGGTAVKAAVKGIRPDNVKIAGKEAPVSAPHAGGAVAGVLEKFTSPGAMEEYQKTQTQPKALEQAVSTAGQPMYDAIVKHTAIRTGTTAPASITGTDTPAPYRTFDDVAQAGRAGAQPTWDKADTYDAQAKAEYEQKLSEHKAVIDEHNKQVDAHNAELAQGESPLEHIEFDPDKTDIEKPTLLSELRSELQKAKANTAHADPAVRDKAYDTDLPKAQKNIDNWFKQHEDVISPEEYESVKNLTRMSERMQDVANALRGPMAKGNVTGSTLRGIEATMDNRAVKRQGAKGVGTFKRLLGEDGYANWQKVSKLFDPIGGTSMRSVGTYALEYLAAHIFGPMGLGVKFGSELLLNRILFDKTWGGWFSRATDAISKSTSSGMAPTVPNELVEEGTAHVKSDLPKLKQGSSPAPQGPSPEYRDLGTGLHEVKTGETGYLLARDTEVPGESQIKSHGIAAGETGKGIGSSQIEKLAQKLAEDPSRRTLLSDDEMTEGAVGSWRKLQSKYPDAVSEYEGANGDPRFRFDLSKLREGETKLSQKAAARRAPIKPTKTKAFKSWFGDSKVVDEKGAPKVLYHGTTHTFNQFAPERGNIEGAYGKGIYFTDSPEDMSHNYAGEGPDLTARIEQRAEQLQQEEEDYNTSSPAYGTKEYNERWEAAKARAKTEIAGEHGGAAMPVYVKMENPIEISKEGGTHFSIDTDDEGNESGNGLKLVRAIHNVVGEYGLDSSEIAGSVMENLPDPADFTAIDFDYALNKVLSDHIDDIYTDEGYAGGELRRKVYQAAGFDGIVIHADEAFPNMKNIPSGTKHYIAFEPEQVKSATGNIGDFDPANPDIRFSTAPAPAGTQANEPVSLADWEAYRGSHPITQEHIESAFPGQDVTKIDDRNFDVSLENGNTIHVQLKDVVDGGGIVIRPGNAVFGMWDQLEDGGVMQLAGIASEQTLGHETFHAAMEILPKRLQEALLREYGDEEAAADAYGDYFYENKPAAKADSLLGQVRDFFLHLYDTIFKPAQAAFREIHEGKVWQRASEKFAESNDLRPNFSVKTYSKWEKDFRAKAEKLGATPKEIEDHIKSVAPAYNMFKGLTDTPPELSGSNLFDNAWEGKHTTFEYQGFCPKNKDFNPTRKAIETEVGHFLTKQDMVGLALLMHAEAKDAPCNYCYTLSGQAAVSENLGKTAREGIWASAEHMPQTTLKLKTRPAPDKPETTQVFIPPVEERLLTDKTYRDSKIANDPELAQKVALQQFYGDKRVYGNLKARKPMDEGIIPARGVMLRLSDEHIADVNSRRGFRISGNADVTPYSYMDVAQDMADFRLRGAKRYSYTKQPMYVRLVGNTGEKVNMSLTMDPRSTDFIANDWSDSMNINEARALRKEFPNAGGMLMALNDNHILAGFKSDDVDQIIGFHGTRGKFPENIRDFVQDYSRENHETDIKTGKSVSGEKEIKQTEHNGDLATYLRICKERGYLPKFARFIYDNVEFNRSPNGVSSVHLKADPETGEVENPVIRKDTSKNFMKLVKDIARTDSPHEPISRNVDTKILEQVTGQMKAGSMNWEGRALPDILKTAVDRLKAGKPIYNGEMGFSYTPTAEVPASKLVQIQPAAKGGNAPQKPAQAPAQQPAPPKMTKAPAPKVTHTFTPKAGLKKVK